MRVERITFTGVGAVAVLGCDVDGTLGRGEVLVATSHVGICGSDLGVLTGHHPWTKPPVVTGHEVCGRVVEVGPSVVALQPGDQVVVNPLRGCGTCARCRRGAVNQCESAAVRGFRLPGAGVTRLIVGERELHRVPASVPPELACLTEPLAAAWHAANRHDELDEVAVIGAGGIGQLVLAALRLRGAGHITVIEPDPGKRALAAAHGADQTAGPGELPTTPRFTTVFDCVSRPPTLGWAASATLAGGAVVTVGVPADAAALPLPRMQRFEIALLGSGMYTPADIDTAVTLIAGNQVDGAPLISDIYPLHRADEAYARAQDPSSVKVMVAMA